MARHIPHLYVPRPWSQGQIQLDETATKHIEKVLRRTDVSAVTYTDGAGLIGKGVYAGGWIERGVERSEDPPPHSVTIAVAPPKSTNRLRLIVEKLADIGTTRLVWLKTRHTEGRPPRPEKAAAWAQAALQQSQGSWLMETGEISSIEAAGTHGALVVADRNGTNIDSIDAHRDVVLCIGPEGGLAEDEVPPGTGTLKLSNQVLRTETAAVAGAVMLIENMRRGR